MNTSTDQDPSELDAAIVTFALNLEYLEAEYYVRSTTGVSIDAQIPELSGTVVTIKTNPKVSFKTGFHEDLDAEIAQDELNHVRFFREAIGTSAVQKLRSQRPPAKWRGFPRDFAAAGFVGTTGKTRRTLF